MGNATNAALSPMQVALFLRVAGIMIPADPLYDVPAANDPVIFADILDSLGRDVDDLKMALSALEGRDDADSVVDFLANNSRAAAVLGRVVLQSYYRDDRVLRAAGQEPRAPFPKGYVLEQGDWSLLDAVRDRPQFWRDDRRA